ncbi:hypothetical protein F4808DRAFT_428991 [Astrocystis sublimbata]|nr:hypothetical protein F4808DRAFT_428991 [Astrocystis sublimbata]
MMKPRKRARPSTETSSPSTSQLPNTNTTDGTSSSPGMPPAKPDEKPDQPSRPATPATPATQTSRDGKRVRKTDTWYGSWPRVSKSSASIKVARENIMGNTQRNKAPADFSRFEANKTPSSEPDNQSAKTCRATDDAGTVPEAVSDTGADTEAQKDPSVCDVHQPEAVNTTKDSGDMTVTSRPVTSIPTPAEPLPQAPPSSTSWLPWLGRSADTSTAPEPSVAVQGSTDDAPAPPETADPTTPLDAPVQAQPPPESLKPVKQASSWFGFWPSSTNPNAQEGVEQENIKVEEQEPGPEPEQGPDTKADEDIVMQDAPPPSTLASATTQPSSGSTWAFWSRDTQSRKTGDETTSAEQGELAVIGDGSETSPRKSSVEVHEETSNKTVPSKKPLQERPPKGTLSKKTESDRLQLTTLEEPPLARPGTSDSDLATKTLTSKPTATPVSKTVAPNLLLPSFKSTYRMKENPSIIKQVTQLLFRAKQPPTCHVSLSKDKPTIKKAIAIGVHGLYPASYLRPMIGQPTGTSLRFAGHCAEAVRRWAESNGSSDCEIEKVALEGEGKIADRVGSLWKLLLNWVEQLRNADFVMLACHSQGVPVGIMLLAKLIDLGVIANSRVGVCAMAGVSLGPFPDYKSGMGMLMGSAAELWQFANPDSDISKRYRHALKTVVDHGVRITYVGSIDDQLVPLESALYSPVCHPYIYRAVFIDGRIHAPDFIAHLVGFALKLRNLGITDHGLIRELSTPLAGSLYTGEGHSRLYDDSQVYDLAISHTLETTSVSGVSCELQQHQGLTSPNPYVLPWIMRGLLEEDRVKTELSHETAELLKQFDEWAPTTKALKDVKYRLEAVRSKL